MKKIILVSLFFASANVCLSQSSKRICEKRYSGYIFDSSFFVFKSIKNQQSRYTPSPFDIVKAERILKEGIKDVNKSRINQNKGCPQIDKNLQKYVRQYIGFINEEGEKIIWINFFWDKTLNSTAGNKIIVVNDGCSYYWNIEININEQSLLNLNVNGAG